MGATARTGTKVGLFIPCHIDAFFLEVGIPTLELLEKLGCAVDKVICSAVQEISGNHRIESKIENSRDLISGLNLDRCSNLEA